MEYRSRRCKGSLLVVLVVVLSGASFASQADGKNQPRYTGTVEPTPTGKAEKKKQCVIVLDGGTVPKKVTDHCELAFDDPAAKMVVKGWYRLYMPLHEPYMAGLEDTSNLEWWWADLKRSAGGLDAGYLDAFAIGLMTIESEGGDSLSFPLWSANALMSAELDPAPGKTAKWDVKVVYSKTQLDQARMSLIQWAHDWKRYRGDKFGFYNGNKLPARIHLDQCRKEEQQAGGYCRSVLRETSKDFLQEDLTIGSVQGCAECREAIRRAKKATEFYAFVKDSWNVEQLKESISKAKMLLPPGLTRADVEQGGSEHLEQNIRTKNQQHKEQNALLTKIIVWQDALDRIEKASKEMERRAAEAKDCIKKHCKTTGAKRAKAPRPKLVLPKPHDLLATAHRAEKQAETGGRSGASKETKDITASGGSGNRLPLGGQNEWQEVDARTGFDQPLTLSLAKEAPNAKVVIRGVPLTFRGKWLKERKNKNAKNVARDTKLMEDIGFSHSAAALMSQGKGSGGIGLSAELTDSEITKWWPLDCSLEDFKRRWVKLYQQRHVKVAVRLSYVVSPCLTREDGSVVKLEGYLDGIMTITDADAKIGNFIASLPVYRTCDAFFSGFTGGASAAEIRTSNKRASDWFENLVQHINEYHDWVKRRDGNDAPVSICWDDVEMSPRPLDIFLRKSVIWTQMGTNPDWKRRLVDKKWSTILPQSQNNKTGSIVKPRQADFPQPEIIDIMPGDPILLQDFDTPKLIPSQESDK